MVDMVDKREGSENTLLSVDPTWSELAREFVANEGEGKLRGGVGSV